MAKQAKQSSDQDKAERRRVSQLKKKASVLKRSVEHLKEQLANIESRESLTLTLDQVRSIPEFKALRPVQRRFLISYLSCNCNPKNAAVAAGVAVWSHYAWKSQEKNYKAAFEKCREIFGDFLEASMMNHAIDGFNVPVHYQGERIDTYKEFNAQERITLLKGMKPEYKENFAAIAGQGPVNVTINYPRIEENDEIDVTPKSNDIPKLERP